MFQFRDWDFAELENRLFLGKLIFAKLGRLLLINMDERRIAQHLVACWLVLQEVFRLVAKIVKGGFTSFFISHKMVILPKLFGVLLQSIVDFHTGVLAGMAFGFGLEQLVVKAIHDLFFTYWIQEELWFFCDQRFEPIFDRMFISSIL